MGQNQRRQPGLDPAVLAVLGDADQRGTRRQMTPAQRKKADRNAKRQRVTFELAPEIVEMVKMIAEFEECSPAGVINLFVMKASEQYINDEITLDGRRRASQTHRWGWVVVLEDLDDLMNRLRQFLSKGRK